jgi:hypothetical protein
VGGRPPSGAGWDGDEEKEGTAIRKEAGSRVRVPRFEQNILARNLIWWIFRASQKPTTPLAHAGKLLPNQHDLISKSRPSHSSLVVARLSQVVAL